MICRVCEDATGVAQCECCERLVHTDCGGLLFAERDKGPAVHWLCNSCLKEDDDVEDEQ